MYIKAIAPLDSFSYPLKTLESQRFSDIEQIEGIERDQ